MLQVVDQDRLIRFARAEAHMQRKHRVPYRTDAEVEQTIRAWLRCQTLFYNQQIVLQEEIDRAILAYRRVRRLQPRRDGSQRALILVAQRTPAAGTANTEDAATTEAEPAPAGIIKL